MKAGRGHRFLANGAIAASCAALEALLIYEGTLDQLPSLLRLPTGRKRDAKRSLLHPGYWQPHTPHACVAHAG